MSTLRTARDRARSEITAAILGKAREHLAVQGAAGLSLRAVARDLDMVSSAVYRYFENRDALLTALIIDAYNTLGEATEGALAAAARRSPKHRWIIAAEAIRAWALEHPQEYALLYGSPVPGYEAPADTVAPGTRVSLALLGVVAEASAAGRVDVARAVAFVGDPGATVSRELVRLLDSIALDVPVVVFLAALLAWTQLFGLLSFEVFGQTRGLVDDHEAFFRVAVAAQATAIGL